MININKKYNSNNNDNNYDYSITLAGNPNTGKSTIFNAITKMHQHTGNWTGKTIENACGYCLYNNTKYLFVDIPGTYSLLADSEEEKIAKNYIKSNNSDLTIIIVDSTRLERCLNLVYQIFSLTKNVIVCVNLIDEASKKGIYINCNNLSKCLGVPVLATNAKKKSSIKRLLNLIDTVKNNKISINPKRIKLSFNKESKKSINNPDITNNIFKKYKGKIIKKDTITYEELFNKLIFNKASKIIKQSCSYKNKNYNRFDKKIDKIITSKKYGIPINCVFFALIFWITIVFANYPSMLLSNFFLFIKKYLEIFLLKIHTNPWLFSLIIDGVYNTVTWIISVMLPPMAIFFPLFTLLEDLGFLPRISFNFDKCFQKCKTSGKQCLTMCMGFGCNAAGVIGTRIINSKRERLIAILTNNFVPCNGRFPFLITIATIFFSGSLISGQTLKSSLIATIIVCLIVLLGIILTFITSNILSKTILKGSSSNFVLELPPYRKPQVLKILYNSIINRTIFVLSRAIISAIPCGIIIWLLTHINIYDKNLLFYISNFLNPFAKLIGLDGYILCAFLLGFPANEIVLPIILMCYTSGTSLINIDNYTSIYNILSANNWTYLTAINVMIISLLHFPCSTTLLTIYNETKSKKWTALAFIIPTIYGIILCLITTFIYKLIH